MRDLSTMPCVTIRVRFKGTHPRFFYVSFFKNPNEIPIEFSQTEAAEIEFWTKYNQDDFAVGSGPTPGASIRNLYTRYRVLEKRMEQKK